MLNRRGETLAGSNPVPSANFKGGKMFNKEINRRMRILEAEVKELKENSSITFENKSTFWGFSTVGVSEVLKELLDKLGYRIKKKSPETKVKYLSKK